MKSAGERVRWGIIGCGDVTEKKSGPGFQKAAGSELVAVMRRNGDLARDYAERHGVPRWYDDAAALIADPEVDAVYVATPPSSHLEYTRMAAEAGKPVYVEKPIALDAAEAEAMVNACEAAGVGLYVAYYRRGLPRFRRIMELVGEARIGQVRTVSTQLWRPAVEPGTDGWRVDPSVAGAGYFADLASHTLDFLDFLLGPVTQAQGFAANQAGLYDAEDAVSADFRYESGVLGTGLWCFTTGTSRDMTEVVGSEGAVRFSSFTTDPIELETAAGVQTIAVDNPEHVQQPLIQMVTDELRGRGRSPSTGRSALRTARVMDTILSDYYRPG
ncbi:MAG: Gfo/Idh/MocA family oxidoreductase [Spirochaetes bacterium]|jgi:predicted dehydrogenase|nr:Gfo/Idh/MocA family oxidoreductase [Spirochaetota bacterium]